MSIDWTPIRRESVDVVGVDPEYSGLLRVEVRLEPWPDNQWQELFHQGPGVSYSLAMHRLDIRGGVVLVRPPDDELEAYVAQVDKRIEAANRVYETSVLPKLQADDAARSEQQRRQRERIEDARRRAGEL